MGKRRNLFIPVIVVILLIAVAFWLIKLKPTDTASSDVDEMVQRVENALGDDFKKQSKTEVAATLVYGNGEEDANINYHILKTTYYEADPNEITGLNIDALNVLFNPESANSCEQMKIRTGMPHFIKQRAVAIYAGRILRKSAMFWNIIRKQSLMKKSLKWLKVQNHTKNKKRKP